jgi:hypothetical protein
MVRAVRELRQQIGMLRAMDFRAGLVRSSFPDRGGEHRAPGHGDRCKLGSDDRLAGLFRSSEAARRVARRHRVAGCPCRAHPPAVALRLTE